MLTQSVTSPPVSFKPWTEATGGSTLPPAGRDGKTHNEGAFPKFQHVEFFFACLGNHCV